MNLQAHSKLGKVLWVEVDQLKEDVILCLREQLFMLGGGHRNLIFCSVVNRHHFFFSKAAIDVRVPYVFGDASLDVGLAKEDTGTQIFIGLDNNEDIAVF